MNDSRPPVQPAPVPGAPRMSPQPANPPLRPMTAAPGIARPSISPGAARLPTAQPMQPRQPMSPAPSSVRPPAVSEDEAISLVDDGDDGTSTTQAPSKIVFGADLAHKKHDWKRTPTTTGKGAVRVKTFHAKLSDQGLEYLDEAINVFIDDHPEVDIKFVTTNVGMFDGKFKDLALVVNVWY